MPPLYNSCLLTLLCLFPPLHAHQPDCLPSYSPSLHLLTSLPPPPLLITFPPFSCFLESFCFTFQWHKCFADWWSIYCQVSDAKVRRSSQVLFCFSLPSFLFTLFKFVTWFIHWFTNSQIHPYSHYFIYSPSLLLCRRQNSINKIVIGLAFYVR